jgi:citrate lyase subunit beta / citryl-CoA lyase
MSESIRKAPSFVRRRASLVVPGSAAVKLAKAPTLGADELVIDLEDAVPAAEKDGARGAVVEALGTMDWGGVVVSVRVNAVGTPWCHLDLIALGAADGPLRSIVMPKVEHPGDLEFVDRLLDGVEAVVERRERVRVQALIETGAGVARVEEIAAACPRLESLIIGYADLAGSLGRSSANTSDLHAWDAIRDRVLVAARANGLQAIDGPYLGVHPDDHFRAGASWASGLGFDGKWTIHPSQVAPLLELFQPSDSEIAYARQVLDTLEKAERRGLGAVALNGQMLDEAMRLAASRALVRAGLA